MWDRQWGIGTAWRVADKMSIAEQEQKWLLARNPRESTGFSIIMVDKVTVILFSIKKSPPPSWNFIIYTNMHSSTIQRDRLYESRVLKKTNKKDISSKWGYGGLFK